MTQHLPTPMALHPTTLPSLPHHHTATTGVFGRRSVSELVSSRAAAGTSAAHNMPCPALLDCAWTLSYVYT